MTTLDELGRAAGAAARQDAASIAAARVDDGLRQLLSDEPIVRSIDHYRPHRPRWITIGVFLATAAAAGIAIVVSAHRPDAGRIVSVNATEPANSSVSQPTITLPAVPSLPTPGPSVQTSTGDIVVRYDSLPPAFHAAAFAAVAAVDDGNGLPAIAVTDNGGAVVVDGMTATIIDPPALQRTVDLSVSIVGSIAAGPGDVVYGLSQSGGADISLVAVALAGERAGQVVASAPVSAVEFVEAPLGVLGHGPNGIIDRRSGKQLLAYVDITGAPASISRPPHALSISSGDLGTGDMVVQDAGSAHDWHLRVERDPTSPYPYNGESPPAASSHGGAVVWTAVGPPADATQDSSSATNPVVAVLAADGTGEWYSLIDGWQVAASDSPGTVLARWSGAGVELAHLDPPQRFDYVDHPAVARQRAMFAATLPTQLKSARPCTVDDLAITANVDGALGTLYGWMRVRNQSDTPCQVQGAPDVAMLDVAGSVVQSSDPAAIAAGGSAPAVILEVDSWAVANLGPVGNNVCGGGESATLRLTVDGRSTTVAYQIGRPWDGTCDPAAINLPRPGTTAVEPFVAIPADDPNSSVNPLADATITVEAPPTVRAGDLLRYDLVVAARGKFLFISNDICPIYTQSLAGVVSGGTASFMLNCNGDDGIGISPNETVRFHMQMAVPRDTAAGRASLTWTPLEPDGTPVSAAITITG
jgi:hypothetical protein